MLLLLRISFCHRSFFKICWLLPKDMCPHTRSYYFPLRGSLSSSWYTQSELKIPKKVRILLMAAKINFNKNLVSYIVRYLYLLLKYRVEVACNQFYTQNTFFFQFRERCGSSKNILPHKISIFMQIQTLHTLLVGCPIFSLFLAEKDCSKNIKKLQF